jgi:hypothetical protein
MVKLIMQKIIIKIKTRCANKIKFSLLGKSFQVTPLVSNHDIGSFYPGFVGNGWKWLKEFLKFFPTFLSLIGCPLQAGTLKCSHQVAGM